MTKPKPKDQKKKPGRPAGSKNKPREQKPLPPPVMVEMPNPENRPDSSQGSPVSSPLISDDPDSGESLCAEAERILAGAPRIQEAPGADVLPDAEEPEDELSIALSGEEQIALVLKSGFGWIADLRDRECYRIDDSTADKLGRAWSPVVRDAWAKYAPALLAQFSQAHPGLLAALLTTSVIVGPMIGADLKQTREERRRRSPVRQDKPEPAKQEPKPEPVPVPAPEPARGGLIYTQGQAA